MKFDNPFTKSNPQNNESIDIGRRNFIKNASIVAGAGLTGFVTAGEARKVYDGKEAVDYRRDVAELTNRAELLEKILELKQRIEDEYGINLELTEDEMQMGSGALYYGHEELRISKQIEALEALEEALVEYPPFMIKQSGLKNVVITAKPRSLNENGSFAAGYVEGGHLEALNRFDQPEMALSYDWNAGHDVPKEFRFNGGEDLTAEEREESLRRGKKFIFKTIVHHELTHFFIDNPGTENSPRLEEAKFAEDWQEKFGTYLNRMRMVYESEARVNTSNRSVVYNYAKIQETPHGFAMGYGLTNLHEDRATIMELLMVDKNMGINEVGPGAEILAEKVAMLKKFYFNQSCGLMDEAYWNLTNQDEVSVYKDPMNLNPTYFKERAAYIINTPYQQSILEGEVSEDTYNTWQEKLAKVYPVN